MALVFRTVLFSSCFGRRCDAFRNQCHMISCILPFQNSCSSIAFFRSIKFHSFSYVKSAKLAQGGGNKNKKRYSSKKQSTPTGMGSNGKGPGLIVFDLDCTLWPFHVDSTVNPPFVLKNSRIEDQLGTPITSYPEVPKVLEYLKAEGYLLAAASRTLKPPSAFQLLELFEWDKFFSYKEIYPGSKVTHFARFAEQTKVPHNQMLFFDDEQRNITDMEKEGVKCVLVINGVDLKLVKDSIERFKEGKI